MDVDRVTQIVKEHIDQALLGLDKESIKFDFKYEWYDLTNLKGVNEFIKDTTALANTYGLDGFIVIGFDDRRLLFKESTFEHSGLRDNNELTKILIKRVSHLFELNSYDIIIDGHKLSVLHIPSAWEKPFLIRNYQTFTKKGNIRHQYQQKIFVRKNTGTYPATKYDLDLMYYDRKNVEPDYRIFINVFKVAMLPFERLIQIKFTIENAGKRPIALVNYTLIFGLKNGEVECPATKVWGLAGSYFPGHSSEIVQPSNIKNFHVEFTLPNDKDTKVVDDLNSMQTPKQLYLQLSNGRIVAKRFDLPTT